MNILIGLLLALGCAVTTNVASVLKHRGGRRLGRVRWTSALVACTRRTVPGLASARNTASRRRPVKSSLALADGSSWPSGHASGSAALYGALLLIALRHSGQAGRTRVLVAAAGVAVLLIGLSGVYLGVHYVSDVAAAWAMTTTWLAFLYHWQLAPRPEPLLTSPAPPAPLPFATAGERR